MAQTPVSAWTNAQAVVAGLPTDTQTRILAALACILNGVNPDGTAQTSTATGISNVRLEDGVTTNLATVGQFHNADNQQPGGSAFGILTGGVAQLLNQAGNLDRQREAGIDGSAAVGISQGAASFAMAFQTTDSTDNFAAGTRTFTPAAMSGTVNGVSWSIQVGSVLSLDTGGNQEYVVVTAVTATTFTCVTAKAHNGTVTAFNITGFVYNQERDAAGELDGASGSGTAVAAEYEYNGGGAGNRNYDRGRNVQGKKTQTTTIVSGGGAGSTSVVLTAAAGIQPGIPLYFADASHEVVYVATNYVSGTTIPLASALVNTHSNGNNVVWDAYGDLGPGLNPVLPTGLGIEEDVVWSPNYATAPFPNGAFFLERAADADAMAVNNIVAEADVLFNGTTFDRARSADGAVAATPSLGREYCTIGTPVLTLLNAVTANVNGTALNLKTAARDWTFQVNTTGAPTAFSVQYQGSLDGVNWTNLGAAITFAAAANITVTATPYVFIRANLTGLTGGTSPTVTALACAV